MDRLRPYPLSWQILLIAYVCGLYAFVSPWGAGLAFCWLGLLLYPSRLSRPSPLLLGLFFLLGACAYSLALPDLPAPLPGEFSQDKKFAITGTLTSLEAKAGRRLQITLSQAQVKSDSGESADLPGNLLLTWDYPGAWPAPGDVLRFSAKLRHASGLANPGGLEIAWHNRLRGVFYRAYARGEAGVEIRPSPKPDELWLTRQRLRRELASTAGASDNARNQGGAMLMAMLLGDLFDLSGADVDRVRRASLSHVMALSGMNVAVVACLGWGLAWLAGFAWPGIYLRIPRPKLAIYLGSPLVLAFLWLGCFLPSLTRAGIMYAAVGLMILRDRPHPVLDGFFLAVGIMLALSPLSAFDIGLQLSLISVAGIILLAPLGANILARLRLMGWGGKFAWFCLGLLWVSFVAQAAILPLAMRIFGEFSPHLHLNLLWVPLSEWVIIPLGLSGFVLTLLAWTAPAGQALIRLAAYISGLLPESLAALDYAGWLPTWAALRPGASELVGTYALLCLLGIYWKRPRELKPWLCPLALALILVPNLAQLVRQNQGQASLAMLDVGQGQSLVIETPGGERALLDGGGSATGFDTGRAVVSPYLTLMRPPILKAMFMSHPDIDHSGGLAYPLASYALDFLATDGHLPKGRYGEVFAAALQRSALTPRVWRRGDSLDLGQGFRLEALWPKEDFQASNENDLALVLRLTRDGQGLALIPSDIGPHGIARLLAEPGDLSAQILLAPHHGSPRSFSPEFLRRVAPKAVFISAGEANQYGFPGQNLMDWLRANNVPYYLTAKHGAVKAVWDSGAGPPRIETYSEAK